MKTNAASLPSLVALAVTAAFSTPLLADEVPTSEHTLTGNLGLFSSYRFRGLDQTFGKPALQGGFDYSHASGLYVGNWNSNVSSGAGYPEGNLEMDFYGGYKANFGDFGIDVGGLYYYYPGTDLTIANNGKTNTGRVDNTEIYLAASWKFISLKYSHAISDYFAMPDSKGTGYLDLSTNYDLGNGWGVNGHVGRLHFRNVSNGSYTDWKLGVTKDISGWVVGAAYVDTNAKGDCGIGEYYCFSNSLNNQNSQNGSKTKDAGRGIAVLSVSKTF
ncbi:TorF family putative porin [Dechloromonas denitrificans]|uniref:TorF family putative porin n=1 Tax=Dechloromonas denitrificans TaxID=281362 RepID=UPI001CF958D1|nr:TorF family putative porin [Dechloromonas denitrificans]UCV09062.1 TorF family putative porin [Dechloromonas denitrificans]